MKPRPPTLLTSPILPDTVRHGFTTREGGRSPGALFSLNLARRPGEDDDRLASNWSDVARAVGCQVDDVALLDQVHDNHVAVVFRGVGPLRTVSRGDGAVTTVPGVLLAVRTADCVPVLCAAPGAVGVAHAGWRGAARGVVASTVEALCDVAGCSASDVVASIGPCVSGAAYEVGDEVVEALERTGVPRERFLVPGGPKARVDVGNVVSAQLDALGVRHDRIEGCTSEDRFYSHRHDGPDTGRQAGVIVLCGS